MNHPELTRNGVESISTGLGSRYAGTTGGFTLKVAGLYDGFTAAVYAHEALGSLTMAVKPHMGVESSVWSFDMLSRLDLRHPSIRVASEADVMIVAANSSLPLPAHVKSWLTLSMQENSKGPPLIVVIHPEAIDPADAMPALHADLHPIARRWGVPLLCNGDFDAHLDSGLADKIADRRGRNASRIHYTSLHSTHPAGSWGINE